MSQYLPFLEKNWILIVAFLLSGALLLWPMVQRRLSPMKEIGTVFVTNLINRQNAVLLDVRESNELTGGKLPNALHIPLSQLKDRMAELAKLTSRPVVVYCPFPFRSNPVTRWTRATDASTQLWKTASSAPSSASTPRRPPWCRSSTSSGTRSTS